MEDILKERLKVNRPNLKPATINTYASILSTVYKNTFPDEIFNINNYNSTSKIIESLKDKDPQQRKTILSALYVLTNLNPYRTLMMKDIDIYNKEVNKQEKNEKQVKSWIDTKDIKDKYDLLKTEANYIYKRKNLSSFDLQNIQNFIIVSLLGGILIPPRRSKDYVDFKIKNIDTTKDNYYNKGKFYFNSYKTADTYGQQVIELPKELNSIIRKWIKHNPTDYLLFDKNDNKLTSIKLNQRLNKLFKKGVGVNQLRHTYLTDKYNNLIQIQDDLKQDTKMMGTSILQEKVYIKKG